MVVECRIAVARGLLDPALLERLVALLRRCRLPTCAGDLPVAVVADVGFLGSTSGRHLAAGLAEAIKKAMIASPEYWHFIEAHADRVMVHDAAALERLVRSAAAIKLRLVERDPYEEDLRRPLNFGHTIGHPLETVTGYGPLLHGEALVGALEKVRLIRAGSLRYVLPRALGETVIVDSVGGDEVRAALAACGVAIAA
jgi:3-dehydroquinate synthase